jgi:hypothetical protein
MTVGPDIEQVEVEEKAEWDKPEVRRITAGSAEDSSGPATDAITNPS